MAAPPIAPTPDWAAGCRTPEFGALVSTKRRLVRPMLFAYLIAYIGTTAVCGFARDLAGTPVWGALNLGYVLIGLNYLLAWVFALIYVRAAGRRFDPMAAAARAALPRPPMPAPVPPAATAQLAVPA